MAHVAIVGAGAWGTALARLVSARGDPATLWTVDPAHAQKMLGTRGNADFFPGFLLDDAIRPTSDLTEALSNADLVVFALPTRAFRSVLEQAGPALPNGVPLVSATKGIENDTLLLMTEVMSDVLGERAAATAAALSGPSFAREVGLGMPTNVVVAANHLEVAQQVQRRFSTERFRVYTSDDLLGVQLGGALKNVIAIAAGVCDALGFGHNSRAALITRGIAEMTRLAVRRGANPLTLSGLAGVGDLVLTCTGELSRNRTVGYELGRGASLPSILEGLGHVAEGVPTTRSAYDLARRLGVDMPITAEVFKVLFEDKAPLDALRDLVGRPLRGELD